MLLHSRLLLLCYDHSWRMWSMWSPSICSWNMLNDHAHTHTLWLKDEIIPVHSKTPHEHTQQRSHASITKLMLSGILCISQLVWKAEQGLSEPNCFIVLHVLLCCVQNVILPLRSQIIIIQMKTILSVSSWYLGIKLFSSCTDLLTLLSFFFFLSKGTLKKGPVQYLRLQK